MTDEQIKRLRELEAKATKGPWVAKEPAFAPGIKARVFGPTYKGKFEGQETMAVPDADFIAAARSAVPELLDEVERLEMENRKLSQHIGDYFYATQETYENMAEEIRVAETNAKVLDKCLKAESAELALRDDELSALRARVEKLEEVRKAAMVVAEDEIGEPGGNPFVCYFCGCHSPSSIAPWRHRDGCPMSALRAALDRAGEK